MDIQSDFIDLPLVIKDGYTTGILLYTIPKGFLMFLGGIEKQHRDVMG